MPEEVTHIPRGSISVTGAGDTSYECDWTRMAIDDYGRIMLIELVASSSQLKGFRAALCGGVKVRIMASAGEDGLAKVSRPKDRYDYASAPRSVIPCEGGYHTYSHRLGYGKIQCVFLSKDPGFMTVVSDETIWNQLRDERFTTPVLREWVPYIRERLEEERLLRYCRCYRCESAMFVADDNRLDHIVSQGIAKKLILIPDEPTAITEEVYVEPTPVESSPV